jgi:carboxynorspermidine decarboxylase
MQSARLAAAVETPALVIDERVIEHTLKRARQICDACGCRLLYSLKPLVCEFVLDLMKPYVDGFAASSLFEAKLARSVIEDAGTVHVTTPGFRAAEIGELDRLCDFVSFNSLGQLRRLGGSLSSPSKTGLRINPQFPLVADDRYNPCRAGSKLGVPLDQLKRSLRRSSALLDGVQGLHFHTNCDSASFEPLLETVEHIESQLGDWLPRLAWINLGGGYLFDQDVNQAPLVEAVNRLRVRHGLEVFLEPGATFVREAGTLITEVIDLFRSGDQTIAVLDTTINHFPEAFEYQFEPDIRDHDDEGDHEYTLVGSTCLAGDLLSVYAFRKPLKIGSRVVLPDVGAYSLVKAHMFNGVNLPTIYAVTREGALVVRRRFTYEDFLSRCGAPSDVVV